MRSTQQTQKPSIECSRHQLLFFLRKAGVVSLNRIWPAKTTKQKRPHNTSQALETDSSYLDQKTACPPLIVQHAKPCQHESNYHKPQWSSDSAICQRSVNSYHQLSLWGKAGLWTGRNTERGKRSGVIRHTCTTLKNAMPLTAEQTVIENRVHSQQSLCKQKRENRHPAHSFF